MSKLLESLTVEDIEALGDAPRIHCDSPQEHDFLMQMLEAAGYHWGHWGSDKKPTVVKLRMMAPFGYTGVVIEPYTKTLWFSKKPDYITLSSLLTDPPAESEPEFVPPSTEDLMAIFDGE